MLGKITKIKGKAIRRSVRGFKLHFKISNEELTDSFCEWLEFCNYKIHN